MSRVAAVILLFIAGVSADFVENKHFIDMNPDTHPDLVRTGVHISAKIGQWMEITCPQYDTDTPSEKMRQFYLHQFKTDKKSFKRCNLNATTVVLSCDSPTQTTKLTLKFQRTSPYPLGFTFEKDGTYYYLAIPKGEHDCAKAVPLIVDLEGAGVVVPPTMTIKTKSSTTSKPTTSPPKTTIKSTTRKSTKLTKFVRPDAQVGDDGNSASIARHITLMTLLLALLTLWLNA